MKTETHFLMRLETVCYSTIAEGRAVQQLQRVKSGYKG